MKSKVQISDQVGNIITKDLHVSSSQGIFSQYPNLIVDGYFSLDSKNHGPEDYQGYLLVHEVQYQVTLGEVAPKSEQLTIWDAETFFIKISDFATNALSSNHIYIGFSMQLRPDTLVGLSIAPVNMSSQLGLYPQPTLNKSYWLAFSYVGGVFDANPSQISQSFDPNGFYMTDSEIGYKNIPLAYNHIVLVSGFCDELRAPISSGYDTDFKLYPQDNNYYLVVPGDGSNDGDASVTGGSVSTAAGGIGYYSTIIIAIVIIVFIYKLIMMDKPVD